MRYTCMSAAALFAGGVLALPSAHGQAVKALYDQNCASCHQADGTGGGAGAQSLIDTKRKWLGGATDRDVFNSIKDGLKEDGMPSYGEAMSDAQVWGLVVYIREMQASAARKADPGRTPARNAGGAATTQHASYIMEDVVEGDLEVPWSIAWLPDGTMLITERPGGLRTFKDGQLSDRIKGTPTVRAEGQGGMMEVAPHPDFARNGWVYLAYSHALQKDGVRAGSAMTRVVRGKIENGAWTDEEQVWQAPDASYIRSGIHFGCKFQFQKSDTAGRFYLFFTHGERGYGERAQDLKMPNGKVHRVWDDGQIPDDNPFVNTPGAVQSIWSWGHRNPQGLCFDLDGQLWETEHGPRGGDELNLVERGKNYGWPLVSFGINYNGMPLVQPFPDLLPPSKAPEGGITMPRHVWLPSIAASGLAVVSGEAFPQWKGDLLAGGQAGNTVRRVRVKDGQVTEQEEVLFGYGRVRDVRCGPDGAIYIALNGPDKIVRLRPAPAK